MQRKEQQLIHSLLSSDSVSFIFIPDDYYVQKESKTYQKLITPSYRITKQSPYIQKMYNLMSKLEAENDQSQGLDGARKMFKTAQRLE